MPTEGTNGRRSRLGGAAWAAAAAVALLAVVLWSFWPRSHGAASGHAHAPPSASPSAPSGSAAAAPTRLALTVVGGSVAGDDTLRVRAGDRVELAIASDRPMVLHLHGYERMVEVGPGTSATLDFVATMPGRFPVHQHREGPDNHRAVFFVEVHP